MKTLVTGATGFIGTHLVKALLAEGRNVKCLVRKSSNTNHLQELGVELFYGDLLYKESLQEIAKNVNIVYHLAGIVHSKKSSDYYKINTYGTQNLLEVLLSEKIERFVYLSSIAATGPNLEHNILLDEQSPCSPIDPYGRSKLGAEKLLMNVFKKHEFPIVIVRPPTVYGPLGRSQIIKKILQRVQKGSFLIMGSKEKLRSMCYIDNLIQGMLVAERFTNAIGEIYFLADERPYTYKEIFKTVSQEMGIVFKETQLPGWIGNISGLAFKLLSRMGFYSLPLYTAWHMVLDMACDITKAKEQLHYRPKVYIKEGIQETVKYYLEKNSV